MDQDRLDELIDKYASGTISSEELRELLDWYHSAEIVTVEWPTKELEEKDHLKERMLLRLQAQIRSVPENPAVPVAEPLVIPIDASADANGGRKRVFRLGVWQVAACLVVIFSSIWIARQYPALTGRPTWVEVRNPTGKIQAIR